MTLTPVEFLPKKKIHAYNEVREVIKEFMDSDAKIARIDYSDREYENSFILYTSIRAAAKTLKYPVKACLRNHQVYLIKK